MGFFFQNIGKLAEFCISESKGVKTGPKEPQAPDSGRFNSIFESLLAPKPENLPGAAVNPQLTEDFQLVEKTEIDFNVIKLLLEKTENNITITIPSNDISHLLDDLNTPKAILQSELPKSDSSILFKENFAGISLDKSLRYNLSFDPSPLLGGESDGEGKQPVEVVLEGENMASRDGKIDVARLIDLVRKYPEPIRMEVELIPESKPDITHPENRARDENDPGLSFRFDLRNLLNAGKQANPAVVKGLLSLKGLSAAPRDFGGLQAAKSEQGGPVLSQDLFNSERYPIKAETFDIPLNFNAKTYNVKNSNPLYGFKSFTPSANDVPLKNGVAETINDNESAGAGRYNSNAKDNSSALSKFSSGSNSAFNESSDNNKGTLIEGLQARLDSGKIIKEDPAFAQIRTNSLEMLDRIEDIKGRILHAVSTGGSMVKFKLQPDNLGTLQIKLVWKADALTADFKVDNAKAAEAVTAIIPELRSGLEDASLKINQISLLINNIRKDLAFGQGSAGGNNSSLNNNNKGGRSGAGSDGLERDGTSGQLSARKTGPATIHKGWIDMKV